MISDSDFYFVPVTLLSELFVSVGITLGGTIVGKQGELYTCYIYEVVTI